MSVNVGSRDKSKRGRAAVSHEPAMGDRIGKMQVGRESFLVGPKRSKKKKKLTEGAALAGRARNEQPPTQRGADGGGPRMDGEAWI